MHRHQLRQVYIQSHVQTNDVYQTSSVLLVSFVSLCFLHCGYLFSLSHVLRKGTLSLAKEKNCARCYQFSQLLLQVHHSKYLHLSYKRTNHHQYTNHSQLTNHHHFTNHYLLITHHQYTNHHPLTNQPSVRGFTCLITWGISRIVL